VNQFYATHTITQSWNTALNKSVSLELITIFMEELNKNKMDNVLGVSRSTHERFTSKVN
jgi:hypothetical protein